ncbi:MAG: hypothetical protein U0353_01070 [Sandaracinus sp.]
MSLSRKMGLGAVLVALVGAGLGAGVAVAIDARMEAREAEVAVITARRELGAAHDASLREPGEVAMVSTRPLPEASRATPRPTAEDARESERLPSPAIVREARTHRVDGTRGGEGLRVRRLVVSTGVEDREPTGASERFERDEPRLYAFVDLANRGDATEVEVVFEPENETREAHVTGLVTLEVPAEVGRHRTWAWSRNVHAPGRWSAIVRDLEGHELARTSFVVEE